MRTASPNSRPHVIRTPDRRARLATRSDRPTRRARADAALINQWLFEQTDRHARPAPTPR